MTNKAKDENDRLLDGTLPDDPISGTVLIAAPPAARATTLRLVRDDVDPHDLPDPSDVQAEAALLAALLWCGAFSPGTLTVNVVRDLLDEPSVFFSSAHREIFKAICTLHEAGTPPDPVLVHSELIAHGRAHKAGGIEYLEQLVASATVCSNDKLRKYAQAIRDAWTRRRLITVAKQSIEDARGGKLGIGDMLNKAQTAVAEVAATSVKDASIISIGQCIQQRAALAKCATGLPTGFRDLDAIFPGFQPEQVSVIAARTSVGKSALAIQLAMNVVSRRELNAGVLYITLEMSPEKFTDRVLSSMTKISTDALERDDLTDQERRNLLVAEGLIHDLPIFFGTSQTQTLLNIRDRANALNAELGPKGVRLGLIVVDHVGLVRPMNRLLHREQQVAETSRGLRWLASNFKCHVIGLAQISREAEKRSGADKMPRLHEMRESGALEQDPDLVFMLHRDFDKFNKPVPDKPAILNVAKARNLGIRGQNVFLKCEPQFVRFSDWN